MRAASCLRRSRTGQINVVWLAFLASAGVLAVFVGLLVWNGGKPKREEGQTLMIYCAGRSSAGRGGRQTIREGIRRHDQDRRRHQSGAAHPCRAVGRGDLFLPAEDSYVDAARKKGLVDEVLPLATMKPVLVVGKGNPKQIESLDDLARPGVKVSVAEPGAAINKLVRETLTKTGDWEKLRKGFLTNGTVADVANTLKLGSIDAGFIWNGMLPQYPDLVTVPVPAFKDVESRVAVAVLKSSKNGPAALKFARYLAARDKGLVEFKKSGYDVVEGDAWAESARLRLYAGAMLRPAIQETVEAFKQREGCDIDVVYNGCGILVSQMKAGDRPDAYFACDTSFMTQVTDLFVDPVEVSGNQLVIVVPKGNPRNIARLKDLGGDGLRVGVGHEKQCALGALTQQTLIQDGTYAAVLKNVKVQSPTGDFLVNQLLTGSLDAVVAYVSNTHAEASKLDAIPIDIPCAKAAQPVAAGRESKYKQMTRRLIDALESRQSKERFESQGFSWKLGT